MGDGQDRKRTRQEKERASHTLIHSASCNPFSSLRMPSATNSGRKCPILISHGLWHSHNNDAGNSPGASRFKLATRSNHVATIVLPLDRLLSTLSDPICITAFPARTEGIIDHTLTDVPLFTNIRSR